MCVDLQEVTRQYQERIITLHRGSKGFGFVLRGAKDASPDLTKQMLQQAQIHCIGLQYFDEIESAGVADTAGLKRGDILLAVNEVDVRNMSHENVVQLIRQSGDKVTMTIATPVPKQLISILKKKGRSNKQANSKDSVPPVNGNVAEMLSSSQSQTQMSQSAYGSFIKGNKAPPPAPPKRDPSTTLSTSRARARSLVVSSEVRSAHNQTIMLIGDALDSKSSESYNQTRTNDNEDEQKCSSPSSVESLARTMGMSAQNGSKVASIRSRSSRRISSYELNEFISRQSDDAKTLKVPSWFSCILHLHLLLFVLYV